MFENVGGDHHLLSYQLVDIQVADRVVYAVALGCSPSIDRKGKVGTESVADHLLLSVASVKGIKLHIVECDGGDFLVHFGNVY